jgi:L-lactate dehydrogenase complex protein LldF
VLFRSLCGACTEVCPVKINLHHHLLHNRRNAAARKPSFTERTAFRIFAWVMSRPRAYGLAKRAGRRLQKIHPLIKGTRLDPAYAWTKTRELPPIAAQTFKEYWRHRK